MNVEHYRRRLLSLEESLSHHANGERTAARSQIADEAGDIGDASVADAGENEDFALAELDRVALQDIDDALKRINDGTFGRCAVDGGPIEVERLDAIPWARYCILHQREIESERPVKTPTI